jgi:hypothetical protein
MDLSPGQRRLLFVVVVIALVGLGIFVIRGRSQGNAASPAGTPTQARSGSAASAAATGESAASPTAASPSASASATPSAAGGKANIYQWLPFSQSDLDTAAKTTLAFASVYANTSYTETKAAYAGKLAGLTTTQEAATLVSDFETPALSATRTTDKQVATGTPTIVAITSFSGPQEPGPQGPPSITFAVSIAQQLVSTSGTQTSTPEYTITIVSSTAGWQVANIQLASLGNQ